MVERTDDVTFPQYLVQGYSEFRTGRYIVEKERLETLATEGQKPQTMLISCCDSRAAPETIFNASPGEMFVLRNVANLVPDYRPNGEYHGVSAGLEFAVTGLKVKHLIVMGHGRCGGVSAALNGIAPSCPGDFIRRWVGLLDPVIAEGKHLSEPDPSLRMKILERAGVVQSISNLLTFPWIKQRVDQGKLNIHGAWFDIKEGVLYTYNREKGTWGETKTLWDDQDLGSAYF